MSGRYVSIDDMIGCVAREVKIRERFYPKWVESGRMKQETANRELEDMGAVLDYLKKQAGRVE